MSFFSSPKPVNYIDYQKKNPDKIFPKGNPMKRPEIIEKAVISNKIYRELKFVL